MLGFRRIMGGKDRAWRLEESRPLVGSKFSRILEVVEGRDVLDVGCVGGEVNGNLEGTSHARLVQTARSCVGIDIVPSEIARWNHAGYEVELASAETFQLDRKFDVIVAADLLEHLASPGAFLERARAHLRPGGRLCLVTPNALSLNNALKSLAGLRVAVNREHTCWFDMTTLGQLLARYGFRSTEEYWQDYQRHPLTKMVLHFRKNLAAHLIVIAELAEGSG